MSTATTTRATGSGTRGLWIVLGLVALLVVFLVLLFCSLVFGTVWGEEFSPDTFDRRTFTYQEIPLIHVQIWPITRTNSASSLEQLLTKNKLIPASTNATPRWDLVSMTHVKPGSEKCDARILCLYFGNEGLAPNTVWLDWTQSNAELAKVFWPVVAKVARQQLYIFVPDLFEAARQATDPKKFQAELDLLLARKYREFGELQQGLEHHEDALTLLNESLGYRAESAAALRARAKSYEALGETDKAAADRVAASKLPDDS